MVDKKYGFLVGNFRDEIILTLCATFLWQLASGTTITRFASRISTLKSEYYRKNMDGKFGKEGPT
jgi:hypothetical protein